MSRDSKASDERAAQAAAPTDTGNPFDADAVEGAAEAGAQAPEASATETASPADDVASLKSSLEEAHERIADLEDRALRAAAEAENVRRRADRSIENAHKFALEKFVEDLLPAVDSFERAVDAASNHTKGEAHTKGEGDSTLKAMAATAEGLELSLKLLTHAMERQGIAVVDPIGAPFDPSLHEAMTMVDSVEAEPGTVIEVFQKGYTVNGRLTRPARVIVARQPEPPTAEVTPPDEAEPGAEGDA